MVSWSIEDSMLAPRDKIEINFKGANPFGIYKRIDTGFCQKMFEVGSTDFWERDFRWSVGSDPHPFFGRLFVRKEFDGFTEGIFEILFQGKQPTDPSKDGEVRISVGGNLRTNFDLSTPFRQTSIYRAFLWLYIKFYYSAVRRTYLKICQEKIDAFNRQVREWTGMPIGGQLSV